MKKENNAVTLDSWDMRALMELLKTKREDISDGDILEKRTVITKTPLHKVYYFLKHITLYFGWKKIESGEERKIKK